jgi:hypothetical protein
MNWYHFVQWKTNEQLFHKLSHCYMFRHYRVILRKVIINTLPSYTDVNYYCHSNACEIRQPYSVLRKSPYNPHSFFPREMFTVWWKSLTSRVTSFFEMGKRFNGIMGLARNVFGSKRGHEKKLMTAYICAVEEWSTRTWQQTRVCYRFICNALL